LLINPNLAMGWYWSGWVKVWLGEPDRFIEHFAHAMRLNPIDPGLFAFALMGTALAHFYAGRHDEALAWAKKALREQPDNPVNPIALRIAAASCALAGHDVESKRLMARLLAVDPTLRMSTLKNSLPPSQCAEYLAKYGDALRKAGLPE